jgi:hypothetical protein
MSITTPVPAIVLLVAGFARFTWPPSSPLDWVDVSSNPDTVPLDVRLVNVPTEVIFGCAAVVTVPAVVAVEALPERAAVIVPAEKFPLASLATIADAVFALVAVVAELDTFPAVEMVASLVSAIAAEELMSALTIDPAVIPAFKVMLPEPLNETAEAVTSPLIAISLAVARVVAVVAFPLNAEVIVPELKLPLASRTTREFGVFVDVEPPFTFTPVLIILARLNAFDAILFP